MRRVLHLDSGRGMRGGQWQALRLHRGLLEAGCDSLLLARADSPLHDAALEQGLPCDVLRPLRLGMLSRRFDLVHAHDSRSHTLGALWARVPLVVSRRVAFPVSRSIGSRWKYGRAALFLAVSEFVAGALRRAGIPASRIRVVYDGVPVPAIAAPSAAPRRCILIPASDDPGKCMELAELSAALAGVPLQPSTDLARDLPGAWAMLYLSRSEGLGSAILLAMAHGVPVIASRVDGIPEIVEDRVNGLLVDNNPEAIARALRAIDPQLYREAARHTVMQRFTERHMIKATLAAYERALTGR